MLIFERQLRAVARLEERRVGKAKVGKLNVDENREIAGKYGIRGIPSLLLFKDGEIKDQMVGVHSKQEISNMISKNL